MMGSWSLDFMNVVLKEKPLSAISIFHSEDRQPIIGASIQ